MDGCRSWIGSGSSNMTDEPGSDFEGANTVGEASSSSRSAFRLAGGEGGGGPTCSSSCVDVDLPTLWKIEGTAGPASSWTVSPDTFTICTSCIEDELAKECIEDIELSVSWPA